MGVKSQPSSALIPGTYPYQPLTGEVPAKRGMGVKIPAPTKSHTHTNQLRSAPRSSLLFSLYSKGNSHAHHRRTSNPRRLRRTPRRARIARRRRPRNPPTQPARRNRRPHSPRRRKHHHRPSNRHLRNARKTPPARIARSNAHVGNLRRHDSNGRNLARPPPRTLASNGHHSQPATPSDAKSTASKQT